MQASSGTNPGPGPAVSATAGCSPSSTDLEERLGHHFANRDLLKRALTHSSANAHASNERLEFLGDRVLGLIVAEELHARYPNDPEGALALKYNALVRQEACARAAEAAGIGEHLVLANSEISSGGRRKAAILAGACEAVIAALYQDDGMDAARRFIACYWDAQYRDLNEDMRDPKTTLQEWAQARKGNASAPSYTLIGREGPDHAPRFQVKVTVNGQEPETGEGGSKREAEQDAARKMLARVQNA
ncbi:MAG: ribonuclease III [Alphaproteobacteria bacterium]|nr:ribonuclease III [Alphaproteobacteria bacterium]